MGARYKPILRVLFAMAITGLVWYGCDNFMVYDVLDTAQSGDSETQNDTQDNGTGDNGTDDPVEPTVLTIRPEVAAIRITKTVGFAASGGEPAYVFSITSGIGTIDTLSGLYTAPATVGAATVTVQDAAGDSANASVTVVEPSELHIYPETITVQVGSGYSFSGAGGIVPYTFSLAGNQSGASITPSGAYTAGGASGTDTVRLTDTAGAQVAASVTVVQSGALGISPETPSIAEGSTLNFTAYGGTPPYSFAIGSGSGAIVSGTGLYTASTTIGANVSEVTVTDSVPNTVSTMVTVVPAPPTDLVANGAYAGNDTIELTWTDNSAAENGYVIERKLIGGTFSYLKTESANATSTVDDTGSPNVLYIYRVRASSAAGLYSAYSGEVYDFSNS